MKTWINQLLIHLSFSGIHITSFHPWLFFKNQLYSGLWYNRDELRKTSSAFHLLLKDLFIFKQLIFNYSMKLVYISQVQLFVLNYLHIFSLYPSILISKSSQSWVKSNFFKINLNWSYMALDFCYYTLNDILQ